MKEFAIKLAGTYTEIDLAKGGATTLTVPTGHIYLLQYVVMRYVADATVATRYCGPAIDIGNAKFTVAVGEIVASETKIVVGGIPLSNQIYDIEGSSAFPFGGLPLYPGYTLEAIASNGQAGDSWTIEGLYLDRLTE